MAGLAYSNPYSRARSPSQTALEVETLLDRYPHLSREEIARLVGAYPYLPMLDYALITADERLAGKIDAFHRDHGHKLRTPLNRLLGFVAMPAAVAAGLLWWVLSALPAS